MNDTKTTELATPTPDDITELIAWANKQPVVMSLLYDLDLMPEQVDERSREQGQMLLTIAHFKASMAEADQQLQAARTREAELAKAINDCISYANGRESEWGERAEACFGFLYAAQARHQAALQSHAVNPASQNNPKETKA